MKKVFIVIIITLLFPLVFIATTFRKLMERKRSRKGEHHFLVIDNAKIGDIVCATPVFRSIKEAYPKSRISVLINPKTAGILKHNPRVDEIVPTDFSIGSIVRLLRWAYMSRFTASIALVPGTMNFILPYLACTPVRSGCTAPEYGNFYRFLSLVCATWRKRFTPNYLSVQFYLDLLAPFGIKNYNLKKEVYYSTEAKQKAQVFLQSFGWTPQMKLVGFSATAGNKMKEWPIEKFIEVAKTIYEEFAYVPIFLGATLDTKYIESALSALKGENIPCISATSFDLEDLPALMSFFSYFVSVDTGPLYIANALDIPVLDILGPCSIYDQAPIYEKCEVVYVKDLPGWPFTSVLKTITELDSEQMQCIEGITPQMVLESFRKLHAKYPPKRDL